jgi:hypothetical protein
VRLKQTRRHLGLDRPYVQYAIDVGTAPFAKPIPGFFCDLINAALGKHEVEYAEIYNEKLQVVIG